MKQLDISVIILTYNEEIHIRRAIENVSSIARHIYVIDCYSKDKTASICKEFHNVDVVEHAWPGNQAKQFNWAIENIKIETEWVLRLDADEYLSRELIEEMIDQLSTIDNDVSAFVVPLRRAFHGKILKHGIANDVKMIRLFRTGKARYEQRLMDEHLEVIQGEIGTFNHCLVDDSLINMSAFIAKHNDYSNREAALLLSEEFELSKADHDTSKYASVVINKRKQKARYAKMPLYWRSFFYFLYRYFIRLGFLDGRAGFEWDFYQGLWYRMLIDSKIAEAKRICGNDRDKIGMYVRNVLGVEI